MNETIAQTGLAKDNDQVALFPLHLAIARLIRISSAQLAFVPFGRPLRSYFSLSVLFRLVYIFR